MRPNATINVSVSSHYREPSYASEITSQGLLGEQVEVIEFDPLFSRIRQEDDYESWISSDQMIQGQTISADTVTVTSHFVRIYKEPSSKSEGVRDAVIGCKLNASGEENGWYRLTLPDGQIGWASKKHFGRMPGCTPHNIIHLAKQFLGYQYTWGGRSPKGFDCSGFVQTVFGFHGLSLPRDSWQQQLHHIVSHNFEDAQPADLIFFGKTPDRVTHVAIALDHCRFIHASGWVKCNSLKESAHDFSQRHLDTFISVNRVPMHMEKI